MIQFRGGYQSLVFIIAQEQILERFPPPFITVCLLFTGIWCQKLIMTQLQTSWRNWWKRAFWVWIMLRSGNVIRDHVCFHWLGLRKIRRTNFPPVKRVDSTSCAVVNQDVSGPVRGGNVSEQADSITLKKKDQRTEEKVFYERLQPVEPLWTRVPSCGQRGVDDHVHRHQVSHCIIGCPHCTQDALTSLDEAKERLGMTADLFCPFFTLGLVQPTTWQDYLKLDMYVL